MLIPVVTASKLGDSPTLFVFSEGISASKPMLMVSAIQSKMLWFITIHLGTPYSHLFTIYPHLAGLAMHSVTMIRPQPRLKFYKKSATGLQFLKLCGLRSAHTHTDQSRCGLSHTPSEFNSERNNGSIQ